MINREEAIEKLKVFAPMVVDDTREALDMAIKALEELPKRRKEVKRWKRKALHAEPVKHGKWIPNENDTYSCSLWQSWLPTEQKEYARYCLYCGAKMDKE